jgi:sulfite reductase (NADPH) hemoprotein beta-component
MLRIAVPYGELSSKQLRQLAVIARTHDRGYGHFTTRQNLQFNWIPLPQAADVMDLLADVDMHGIQTSGNCVRNITSDALAGIAPDEEVDPRPYCEILRQWSTLHPEFAFLPRKFKIAVIGAHDDRAAIGWHDIGLRAHKNDAGEIGFKVLVGGGMGRTPVIGTVVSEFVPWQQILVFVEAILRVYNRYGRRDNMYKARIKILVKAEGERFIQSVQREFASILERDAGGSEHLIPRAELDRVARHFVLPAGVHAAADDDSAWRGDTPLAFQRWLERNVHAHRLPGIPRPSRCRSSVRVRHPAMPRPIRWTLRPSWPTASASASCASRTTRTCCCHGCAPATCACCGKLPARPASPRRTSASSPT